VLNVNTLDLVNLSYQFADAKEPTFQRVSLSFQSGQMTLIYSPSGSGKSTLLKTIAGFYPQYNNGTANGNINFNQKSVNELSEFERRKLIAMMFQNPSQQFCMPTVYEEFIFTLENLQLTPQQIEQTMQHAVKACHIEPLLHRKFTTLSGGEKQRVALSIIIAINAPIIMLDEPFASVDPESRNILMHQLMQLKQAGKILIGIDHDLTGYQDFCDHLVIFDSETKQFKQLDIHQQLSILQHYNQPPMVSCQLPSIDDHAILTIDNLALNNGNQQLIQQEHLDLFAQATTLISGKNGSGKSTFFKAIIKQKLYNGSIKLSGKSITKIKPKLYFKKVGLLFQDTDKQFLKITVQEDINLSRQNVLNQWLTEEQIQDFIERLGLAPLLNRVIYSLSEGQKKRLQILIMAIMGHPILLLDEPFSGINLSYLKEIIALLNITKANGQTQFIISHQTQGLKKLINYHLVLQNHQFIYQEAF
jgi:energy-coupling factor transport system ATP-binding protein